MVVFHAFTWQGRVVSAQARHNLVVGSEFAKVQGKLRNGPSLSSSRWRQSIVSMMHYDNRNRRSLTKLHFSRKRKGATYDWSEYLGDMVTELQPELAGQSGEMTEFEGNLDESDVDEDSDGDKAVGALKWEKFGWMDTGDMLYACLREKQLRWDCGLRRFIEVNPPEGQPPWEFVPPLIQPVPSETVTPSEYLESLARRGANQGLPCAGGKQLMMLLSASSAALGIFNEGKLTHHKIITAYTVRKSQGSSQLSHLRQGGGRGRMTSGGNLRTREVRRLYTRINEKIKEWETDIKGCEILFQSGGTRVWNEVFACKEPPAGVQREDARWQKIPDSVREPRMRELVRVFYKLSHGAVGRYDPPDGVDKEH